MRKIYAVLAVSLLILPAYATETENALAEEVIATNDTVSETSTAETTVATISETSDADYTNPDIKFPHGLQLGLGVSATGGMDWFVGYANKNFDSFWLKRFGLRLNFATTAPLKSAINSGLDSIVGDGLELGDGLSVDSLDLDAQHFAALVDFYPFGDTWFLGGIRITGGYYWGRLNASANIVGELDGAPAGGHTFELYDTMYMYTGNDVSGTAELNWDYNGPYLGAGFDLGLFAGLKIYFDAGVVFTNRAAQLGLDLPLNNLMVMENGAWAPVDGPLVDEFYNIRDQALADAQEELDKLTFYPMVKIGFMYRF